MNRERTWALYGRTSDGNWELIDKRNTNDGDVYALPKGDLQEKSYIIDRPVGLVHKYEYYRFEVKETFAPYDYSRMQLAELRFD